MCDWAEKVKHGQEKLTSPLLAFHGSQVVSELKCEVGSFISESVEIQLPTSTWNSYRCNHCFYIRELRTWVVLWGNMAPCIGIASRGSGKGREIHADMTLQLRQCYGKQVNTESLLWKSSGISFQNRSSQCSIFLTTGGPQSLLWVVCEGLSSVDVCDGTSRSLVSQSLPPSLGLEPITPWTDLTAWSCQSADDVSQQCPVLYIMDPG